MKSFKLKNKNNWSKNRFAWVYAILIWLGIVIFTMLLKYKGIYDSMSLRAFNIFFILIGFFLLVRDYKKSKGVKLDYLNTLLLCIRTGFYFCLLYLPFLLFYLSLDSTKLYLFKANETSNPDFSVIGIVFAAYIETVASIVILSILAAYTGSTGTNK